MGGQTESGAANRLIVRRVIGACCLAAATCALFLSISSFFPIAPDATQKVVRTQHIGNYAPSLDAESIVEVQVGDVLSCERIVQGKRWLYSEEELAALSQEELAALMSAESWEVDFSGLRITVRGATIIEGADFLVEHPHYAEADPFFDYGYAFKIVLVEVEASNASSQAIELPDLLLWIEDFLGASDRTNNGLHPDKYALAELYGVPVEGSVQYRIPGDWRVVEPGETRILTIPYLASDTLFKYANDYERLVPRDLCLSVSSYDLPTVYRLWLG